MKIFFTTLGLAITVLVGSSAFMNKSASGYAGYTGSPGESTCGNCHGGGSSAVSGITITSNPAFLVNASSQTEYLPDSTYQITLDIAASGFTRFGFGCEILNSANTNSGNMQNQGAGVKFLTSLGKKNAVHTIPKVNASGAVSFTFKWVAPTASNGDAIIYAIGNAVNGNGSTSGDFVLTPVAMSVVEGTPPAPPEDPTGIKENMQGVSRILVFPNPASDITNISYSLKQTKTISVQLLDIKGTVVKELYNKEEGPGEHTQILNLQGIASGVYFIKTSANQQKVSQKLITVQ